MKVQVVLLFATCLISASASAGAPASKQSRNALVAKAKVAIKKQLRDPESARFEILGFPKESANGVCGTVNAKNGFGGYAGAHPFLYSQANGKSQELAVIVKEGGASITKEVLSDADALEAAMLQMIAVEACKPENLTR